MRTALVLCCLLLTACNDEQGPKAKVPDGGKPFHVPDVSTTAALFAGALVVVYLIDKRINRR